MSSNGRNTDTVSDGMTVDGALGVTMSRRRVLRLFGAVGVAAVVAGAAKATPAAAATAGAYFTTTDLNLRAKPSTSATVLLVIPDGKAVEEIGDRANGFLKVRYGGKTGWVYEAYLRSPATQGAPQIVGLGMTTTDVNLRSGPSTSHQVLRVLDPSSEVSVSANVENGFRQVVHLGLAGWVWDAFIGNGGPSAGPERLTTTSALNLRATASTSAKVLTVIPEGATVGDQGESSNGFRKVAYQGAIGWCWADYLN